MSENDQLDLTKPPANVFNIPDLCRKCGGTGIIRPTGKFYETAWCYECGGGGYDKPLNELQWEQAEETIALLRRLNRWVDDGKWLNANRRREEVPA